MAMIASAQKRKTIFSSQKQSKQDRRKLNGGDDALVRL